jgi:hypothetical protein
MLARHYADPRVLASVLRKSRAMRRSVPERAPASGRTAPDSAAAAS